MHEDGSLSGGAGGTDIAVIYDPIRRSFTFLIVPPSLVSFVECVGDCLVEMAMHVGPEALAAALAACSGSCQICRQAPGWNIWCGICVGCAVGVVGVSTYCAVSCL